jgi:hypothetical protein
MNVYLSQKAIEQLADAPLPVQKAFIKQISFVVRNLNHPGLHAKKYIPNNYRLGCCGDPARMRLRSSCRYSLKVTGVSG